MRIKVTEATDKPAGWARVLVSGEGIGVRGVTAVMIARDVSGPSYLAGHGWQAERHWIPVSATPDASGRIAIDLGPEVTRHVRPNSNVEVTVSADGAMASVSSTLIWPAIQQPASAARSGRRISVGGTRKPEPERPSEPLLPPEEPPKVGSPPPTPLERTRHAGKKPSLLVSALLVAGAAVVGITLFLLWERLPFGTDGEPVEQTQETMAPLTLEQVRGQLSEGMSAEDSLAEAERQRGAGDMNAALLLYKRASSGGLAGGHVGLARMYDPGLFSPESSPLSRPNASRAVELYGKAAELGYAFAMRRMGILLYEGADGVAADSAAGRLWLEKAAEAGDEEAKAYLEKI